MYVSQYNHMMSLYIIFINIVALQLNNAISTLFKTIIYMHCHIMLIHDHNVLSNKALTDSAL